LERFESGVNIGGLRVIVELYPGYLGDEFDPVLHPLELSHGVPDSVQIYGLWPGCAERGADRSHHVFHIVKAHERNLSGPNDFNLRLPAVQAAEAPDYRAILEIDARGTGYWPVARAEIDSPGPRRTSAGSEAARVSLGHVHYYRIVPVQDGPIVG